MKRRRVTFDEQTAKRLAALAEAEAQRAPGAPYDQLAQRIRERAIAEGLIDPNEPKSDRDLFGPLDTPRN